MRRLIIGCSAAAVLLVGGLAVSTAVQATTPPTEEPTEVHPFVGAWIYTVDGFPEAFTVLAAIDADGTWLDTGADGPSSIGSWEATGPNSFSLTFHSLSLTEDGSVVLFTIRAAGEVSEDGQSWTAEYTAELTGEGAPPRRVRRRLRDRNAYQRRADGHPSRSRGSPLPRPLPARGRHRASGHRTVGDRTGRCCGGNHDGLVLG